MLRKRIVLAIGIVSVISITNFLVIKVKRSAVVNPAVTISMTKDGFSPSDIVVRIGDAVKFLNDTEDGYFWPASNLHPTHELYPEFDPREPMGPGDSWTFIFKKKGEWRFHDHLKANKRGVITVID